MTGISSALIIDELVYLIATNGSDQAYQSFVSLIGALILAGVVSLICMIAYYLQSKK